MGSYDILIDNEQKDWETVSIAVCFEYTFPLLPLPEILINIFQ